MTLSDNVPGPIDQAAAPPTVQPEPPQLEQQMQNMSIKQEVGVEAQPPPPPPLAEPHPIMPPQQIEAPNQRDYTYNDLHSDTG